MNDKTKHFIAGFLLSLVGFVYVPLCILGFLAGALKEWYDLLGHGVPDWYDLAYTWAGAGLATLIVLM